MSQRRNGADDNKHNAALPKKPACSPFSRCGRDLIVRLQLHVDVCCAYSQHQWHHQVLQVQWPCCSMEKPQQSQRIQKQCTAEALLVCCAKRSATSLACCKNQGTSQLQHMQCALESPAYRDHARTYTHRPHISASSIAMHS
jgi:hypothetical protein